MAMVIKNNESAVNTLNSLNKNASALQKSLQKVSSGMRINGAADDASGYAISERMRVQVRALDQANRNTQNGRSMMRVAEGAVASAVEILKTMKEKALDAANDTNTDIDRATIQKQLDEAINQLDENAEVTFNGKRMLDGSMTLPSNVEQTIVKALNTEWIENSLLLIEGSIGMKFRDPDATVNQITVVLDSGSGQNGTLAYVAALSNGNPLQARQLELHINMDYYNTLNMDDVNGSAAATGAYLDRTLAHEFTHAVMAANIDYFSQTSLYVIEGMAEVVHGIDDERRSRILSLATGGASTLQTIFNTGGSAGDEDVYAGGYMFLRYMEKQCGGGSVKRFVEALSDKGGTATGMDMSVRAVTQGAHNDLASLTSAFMNDFSASGGGTTFLKDYCGIDLSNQDTGALTGKDAGGSETKTAESVVPEAGSTLFWYFPNSRSSFIEGLEVIWPSPWQYAPKTVTFQVGTKANQAIKIGFSDMRAEALGLKDKDGKTISVATQRAATNAIHVFDQAITKALDQQTTIGALESRLEYMSSNLILNSENTQTSESTIRDADMAKEMTEYTKANVLLQSAQSMLAQANQNSSSVLGLLQ